MTTRSNEYKSAPDPYTALWVSYSSISDFLACPRAYFLRNVYKNPKNGHKMTIMNPPLALGQAVHEVLDVIARLPKEKRFDKPLLDRLDISWKNISEEKGGFVSKNQEDIYKERARKMLIRVIKNPGPVGRLSVKLKDDLPHYFLSEKDNIILCGKVDWLEYLPETDSVHIIDFKTSKREEDIHSLQFPIYNLLVSHCQKRKVSQVSYWYLEFNNEPNKISIVNESDSEISILKIAKDIKLARQLGRFRCLHGTGCQHCLPYESILRGDGVCVGSDRYRNDVYTIAPNHLESETDSIIH